MVGNLYILMVLVEVAQGVLVVMVLVVLLLLVLEEQV
jgi:hypothetical protein